MAYNHDSLLYKTESFYDITDILRQIQSNNKRHNGEKISSNSLSLWDLRRAKEISSKNKSKEKLLEKAVAILACRDHMPNWYNQVPAASGIINSDSDRKTSVDLAHWDESSHCLNLIELKWQSDTPADALREILRYGAVYLFCREHKNNLPLWNQPAMSANHVVLEIVAPHSFYYYDRGFQVALSNARNSLDKISAKLQSLGLGMTLEISSFPKDFNDLPFENGDELRNLCDTPNLTQAGEIIRNAFRDRKPV